MMGEESHIYLFVLVRKLFLQLSNHAFLSLPAWSTVFIIAFIGNLLDEEKVQHDNMNR